MPKRLPPMVDDRPSRDEWYLHIADEATERAECVRRQIVAILVNADGFCKGLFVNGGYPKGPSCLLGQCPRAFSDVAPGSSYDTGSGSCIALHAEQNLVANSSVEERRGGTAYISDAPCDGCTRTLQGTGLVRIKWRGGEWRREATGPYGSGPHIWRLAE